MGGNARARLLVEAQGPLALDELEEHVVEIVEDADIAALAELVDEVLQDETDGCRLIERAQRGEGEPGESRADGIALARMIADNQPQLLELAEDAMHCLTRQPEPGRQV